MNGIELENVHENDLAPQIEENTIAKINVVACSCGKSSQGVMVLYVEAIVFMNGLSRFYRIKILAE